MRKRFFTLLLSFSAVAAQGQEWLWQKYNESLPVPMVRFMPKKCSDNTHQEPSPFHRDGPAQHTIDRDESTLYHSAYSPSAFTVTPENPAELIYDFENVERIDYLEYVPRQDGGVNGLVTEAEIYVKTESDSDYRLHQQCHWSLDLDTKRVDFKGGLLHPVSIKVRFLQGVNNCASCAEMRFSAETGTNGEWSLKADTEIFADELLTSLKPGKTQADIEKIQQPVIRKLAHELLQGTYTTDYRVATYDCYDSPQWLSRQWNTPNKYYDQFQGVTGIVMEPGKHMLTVSNLPDSMEAKLKVVAWYTGKTGRNFDGNQPDIKTFNLHNGVNIIDYDSSWSGLAYIAYFSEGYASANPPINVHFVGGTVNGYLTPDMTNEQMHRMTAEAPSRFIDVVSRKVHAVWTSAGMHEFCKADDGISPGYRQYMNILDTLMTWEQRLVGFEKYKRIPRNRTLFYVNFTFGVLFQNQLGISTHVDNERLYLNCRSLLYDESETIWGMSHEWGHQHQLAPNFCWTSTQEVTNNLSAYYNLMHLGYRYEQLDLEKRQGLEKAVSHYFENETDDCIFESNYLYDRVFERLFPFLKLCNYFMNEGGQPDFLPDLYETLRHVEVTPDSTNIVPYVINFIRTASQLSGYNLLPYFERFGFLRVKSFDLVEYGKAHYNLTQKQLDALRNDMNALVRKKKLKPMSDGMIEAIVRSPDVEYERPHFEN